MIASAARVPLLPRSAVTGVMRSLLRSSALLRILHEETVAAKKPWRKQESKRWSQKQGRIRNDDEGVY
eukprot:993559-Rhodomonas_salina.1